MREKIFFINLGNTGSTGKIMQGISEIAEKYEYNVYMAYPKRDLNSCIKQNDYIICNNFFRKVYEKLDAYMGVQNCLAVFPTIRLIKKIQNIKPDIIHLHNIHGGYLNIILLFMYLKRCNIPIVWTLHDCWSFTGRCPHFILEKCEKWKIGCSNCTYPKKEYPAALWDYTRFMWKLKKKLFTSVKELTLVTPSQWLADLVKESFLKKYPIKVINNGINLNIFKYSENDFRKKYNLENKIIILGVSFAWSYSKGLDVFISLAKILDDKFKIVLVGTNQEIEKILPENILCIRKTNNQNELAEIYSSADILINPTRQDTFPTINIESIACGTPVITYKTGGSPEILDEYCGIVVECDNIDILVKSIINVCQNKIFSKENCIKRAFKFNKNEKFETYIELYKEISQKNININ